MGKRKNYRNFEMLWKAHNFSLQTAAKYLRLTSLMILRMRGWTVAIKYYLLYKVFINLWVSIQWSRHLVFIICTIILCKAILLYLGQLWFYWAIGSFSIITVFKYEVKQILKSWFSRPVHSRRL